MSTNTRTRAGLAGLLVTLLAMIGVVVAAERADATDGNVTAEAYCIDATHWGVVWTWHATNVPEQVEGDVKAITTSAGTLDKSPGAGVMAGAQVMLSAWTSHAGNWPGVPVHHGNYTEPFSTVGIPTSVGSVTTMVQYDYSNGHSGDPTGSASQPDCEGPGNSEKKIEFCHLNQGNGFVMIETSRAAFYVGHREHPGDIYPAESYTKGHQTYSWPAQGNQALLATGCTEPTETPTPTPTEPPTPSDTPTPTETPTPTVPPTTAPPTTAPPTTAPPTTAPPTSTPTPTPPPTVGPPPTRVHSRCLGNALIITKETYRDGKWETTSTSSIEGAERCETPPGQPPIEEEGL